MAARRSCLDARRGGAHSRQLPRHARASDERLGRLYRRYGICYYQLFQLAIASGRHYKQAKKYINLAYEHDMDFFGDAEIKEVREMEQYRRDPKSHPVHNVIARMKGMRV